MSFIQRYFCQKMFDIDKSKEVKKKKFLQWKMHLAACFDRTHAEHRSTTGFDAGYNHWTRNKYSSYEAVFIQQKKKLSANQTPKRQTSFYVWFWIIKSEFDIFETN